MRAAKRDAVKNLDEILIFCNMVWRNGAISEAPWEFPKVDLVVFLSPGGVLMLSGDPGRVAIWPKLANRSQIISPDLYRCSTYRLSRCSESYLLASWGGYCWYLLLQTVSAPYKVIPPEFLTSSLFF